MLDAYVFVGDFDHVIEFSVRLLGVRCGNTVRCYYTVMTTHVYCVLQSGSLILYCDMRSFDRGVLFGQPGALLVYVDR